MTNNPYDYVGVNSGAHFDGSTYNPVFDYERLTGQLKKVYDIMRDGQWHRLSEIAGKCECKEQSISARIRDLRKDKFGAHTVDRKRHDTVKGLFLYRLDVHPQRELFEGTALAKLSVR